MSENLWTSLYSSSDTEVTLLPKDKTGVVSASKTLSDSTPLPKV